MGWPKTGKSTLGSRLAKDLGLTHLCTDPQAMCPPGVQGVSDRLEWSEVSQFVSDEWLGLPDTIIEGVALPRALRKWKLANPCSSPPCDKIIFLKGAHCPLLVGQINMGKGMDKVLAELRPWLSVVPQEIAPCSAPSQGLA